MPQVQSDSDAPEDIEDFMQRRQDEQAAQTPDAWAAANQAYGQAIRTGQGLNLQRPADVLAYGAGLSPADRTDSATTNADVDAAPCPSPTQWQGLPEPILQANAALRAAANTITFGQADHFAAAMDALLAPGDLGGWSQRYNANLQQQHALDQYDVDHRPIAQATGSVGGGLLGLAATGPLEGGLAVSSQ